MRPEILRPISEKFNSVRKQFAENVIEQIKKRWEIELKGKENFKTARQHLQEGSLIIAFNHSFSGDSFCGSAVSLENFQNQIKYLIMPAGKKHLHIRRAMGNLFLGKLWPKANMTRIEALKIIRDAIVIRTVAQIIDAELITIVQDNDIDFYGQEKADATWRGLFKYCREMLPKPGTVMFYTPEGHRSKDGQLKKTRRGITTLLERGGNHCLCLPLGIFLEKNSQDTGLNLGEKVIVNTGPLVSLKELTTCQKRPLPKKEKEKVSDRLMREHLAPLLPENLHGVYRNFPS